MDFLIVSLVRNCWDIMCPQTPLSALNMLSINQWQIGVVASRADLNVNVDAANAAPSVLQSDGVLKGNRGNHLIQNVKRFLHHPLDNLLCESSVVSIFCVVSSSFSSYCEIEIVIV